MLSDELLKCLSFYEPMNLEKIYLDLDQDFLMENPELTTNDLLQELQLLERAKKLKKTKRDGQFYWQRLYPKRSWWRSIFSPFKK